LLVSSFVVKIELALVGGDQFLLGLHGMLVSLAAKSISNLKNQTVLNGPIIVTLYVISRIAQYL